MDGRTNGWMDYAILRPFKQHGIHEYQYYGRAIMKGCVQWDPVYSLDSFRLQCVSNPGQL